MAVSSYAVPAARCGEGNAAGVTWGDSLGKGDAGRAASASLARRSPLHLIARTGVLVNVTPFEPEWEGFVTVSIANTTPVPVRIFANEGLCQVLFFQSDEPCEVSYKDRKGKYQAQRKIEFGKT